MKRKRLLRFLGGGVVGAFALMIVELLWHDSWFGAYYESIPYITRPQPDFTAPSLAFLLRGLLMAAIYPTVHVGGSAVGRGIMFGAVVGLLSALYWVPSFYAQHPIPSAGPWFLLEGAFFLLQGAAAGLLIALIYGHRAKDVGSE